MTRLRTISPILCFFFGLHAWAAVVIKAPANGATVTSPVPLNLTVTGFFPNAIQVYDNSNQVIQKSGTSSIQTTLTLTPGSHTITAVAIYGRSRSDSAKVTITVSSPTSGGGSGGGTGGGGTTNPSLAAQIAGDMQGGNEGFPHGVPLSYDWANGPVMGLGNNSNGMRAMTAWGVVYVAAEGNPATNTRVNIRDMQAYLLQKSSGKWLLLQNTSTPEGAAYVEDFSGDSNKPADIRYESDGTISVTAGGGFNFHFDPPGRASINPSDIGGIVTLFQARLIVGNPSKPDDRSSARYIASSGGDYWPDLTGGMPPGQTSEPAIALGKMKYVQTGWRSFAMTTMSQTQLTNNPPPINLSGIAP